MATRVSFLAALSTFGCGGSGNTYQGGAGGATAGAASGSGGSNNSGGSNSTVGGLGGGGNPGTGGSSAGAGGGAVLDESVCAAVCAHFGECGRDGAACLTNCQNVDQVFTGACLQKQYAELNCVGMLDCAEIANYTNDKLAHPTCGAVYADFATCLRGGGTPPPACDDFCQTAYTCASDLTVEPPGCAQNCNEILTGYDIVGGAVCGNAMEDVFGCYSGVDCVTMRALLEQQASPAECDSYVADFGSACGL